MAQKIRRTSTKISLPCDIFCVQDLAQTYYHTMGRLFSLPLLLWAVVVAVLLPAEAFLGPAAIRHRAVRPSTTCFSNRLDKGFNLLEIASGVVPQGAIVNTAKEGWKFAWQRMMAELAPQDKTGNYVRPSYSFQGQIGTPQFPDEPGRYHLYVGNPCPWCHRTKLAVNMLGFDAQQMGVTMLLDDPVKASRGGWVFAARQPDPLGNRDLRGLYDQLSPGYQGRCTAPLLVDKKARKIVSNESSDIVRMLNNVSLGKRGKAIDLYPKELEAEIDATNEWTYKLLNNGVYRCGFSTTQGAYDQASAQVREGLKRCETILQEQDYLCGSTFTEADLRLLPTILRFDAAYAPLFKVRPILLTVPGSVIVSEFPQHFLVSSCYKSILVITTIGRGRTLSDCKLPCHLQVAETLLAFTGRIKLHRPARRLFFLLQATFSIESRRHYPHPRYTPGLGTGTLTS